MRYRDALGLFECDLPLGCVLDLSASMFVSSAGGDLAALKTYD